MVPARIISKSDDSVQLVNVDILRKFASAAQIITGNKIIDSKDQGRKDRDATPAEPGVKS